MSYGCRQYFDVSPLTANVSILECPSSRQRPLTYGRLTISRGSLDVCSPLVRLTVPRACDDLRAPLPLAPESTGHERVVVYGYRTVERNKYSKSSRLLPLRADLEQTTPRDFGEIIFRETSRPQCGPLAPSFLISSSSPPLTRRTSNTFRHNSSDSNNCQLTAALIRTLQCPRAYLKDVKAADTSRPLQRSHQRRWRCATRQVNMSNATAAYGGVLQPRTMHRASGWQ